MYVYIYIICQTHVYINHISLSRSIINKYKSFIAGRIGRLILAPGAARWPPDWSDLALPRCVCHWVRTRAGIAKKMKCSHWLSKHIYLYNIYNIIWYIRTRISVLRLNGQHVFLRWQIMVNWSELKWIGNELGAIRGQWEGIESFSRSWCFPNPWPVHQDWGGVPQSTPRHSRAKQTPS